MGDPGGVWVLALVQIRLENSGEGEATECNFFPLKNAQDKVGEIEASHEALEH